MIRWMVDCSRGHRHTEGRADSERDRREDDHHEHHVDETLGLQQSDVRMTLPNERGIHTLGIA